MLSTSTIYYPFGMIMPNSNNLNTGDYRFGFNGQEMDNEVSGNGNLYDYGFRIYNPRLGRFLSVDPLMTEFPWYTPYQFSGNKPIAFIDLDGLEDIYYTVGKVNQVTGGTEITLTIQAGTAFNSNDGQLLVHNSTTGTSYKFFPFSTEPSTVGTSEFDGTFGVSDVPNTKTRSSKPGTALIQNPTRYYFGLNPNSDIFPNPEEFTREQINESGEVIFAGAKFEVFPIIPFEQVGGNVDPLETNSQITTGLVTSVQSLAADIANSTGQNNQDITEINIELAAVISDRVGTQLTTALQSTYPNATITISGDDVGNTGTSSVGITVTGSAIDIQQ